MNRQLIFAIALLVLSIQPALFSQAPTYPAADGFDDVNSDPQAVEIAHETVAAMGGYENWDKTRYISWKFFGRRFHLWDKWTGNIRVDDKEIVVLMNIHSGEGSAWKAGVEVTEPDSISKHLTRAKSLWINDSYWVVMPYKLKDSGVTLKYRGEGTTTEGNTADVLELSFSGVGDTPENKYAVYVDKETRLVVQWDFYSAAADESSRFTNPWSNWRQYGQIQLSDDRGRAKHTDVAVYDDLPPEAFSDPSFALPDSSN